MRQQGCHEQKWRRIVPGEVARIALAEHRDLNLFLNIPIIGQRRMAIEHQLACGPDVDEIGRDAQAIFVKNPPMRKIRRRKEHGVDDEQREADIEERRGNGVSPLDRLDG